MRNDDRCRHQLLLQLTKCLKTRFIKMKLTLLLKQLAQRMCNLWKILDEPPVKAYIPKKTSHTFYEDRWRSRSIISTLAQSTPIPFSEMRWPNIIPSFTMKCHFPQFSTRLQSSHLLRTSDKLLKHRSKESPTTEKSSINTSIVSSTISENIDTMHLLNVAGALHNLNDILLNAKVPYGQVKVVISWSSGVIEIWLYPE